MASYNISRDVSLAPHNTFGLEAKAAYFLELTDVAQLAQLRADAARAALPRLILGGGSNVLLKRDFPGLVIQVALQGIELLSEEGALRRVRVAAGENWHGFVMWTLAQGYGGLENLSLIPGSVGAAPIQNIVAYGVEA